jgi:hypothetical protein
MAKIKQYQAPREGFYITHSFRSKFVTYQVHPKVEELFRALDLEHGFELPHDLLDRLREQELIFTGGAGVQEEVIIEVDSSDIEEIENDLIDIINTDGEGKYPEFDGESPSEPSNVFRPQMPIALIVFLVLVLILGVSAVLLYDRF